MSVPVKPFTRSSSASLCGSKVEPSKIRVDDRAPACPKQLVPGRCEQAPQHMRNIVVAHQDLQATL